MLRFLTIWAWYAAGVDVVGGLVIGSYVPVVAGVIGFLCISLGDGYF